MVVWSFARVSGIAATTLTLLASNDARAEPAPPDKAETLERARRADAYHAASVGLLAGGLAATPLIVLFGIPLGLGTAQLEGGTSGNAEALASVVTAVNGLRPATIVLGTLSGASLLLSGAFAIASSAIAPNVDVSVGAASASIKVTF